MFKYTPRADIIRQFRSIENNSRRPRADYYALALKIVHDPVDLFACGDFWYNYLNTAYYAIDAVQAVPVGGVLVPVDQFEETVV